MARREDQLPGQGPHGRRRGRKRDLLKKIKEIVNQIFDFFQLVEQDLIWFSDRTSYLNVSQMMCVSMRKEIFLFCVFSEKQGTVFT